MKSAITIILFTVMTLNGFSASSLFLRVYNTHNMKTAKGILVGTTDSSLIISQAGSIIEIPCSQIGSIKTLRSIGHKILVSSIVSFGVFAAVGLASFRGSSSVSNSSNNWNFAIKVSAGDILAGALLSGATIGSVTGLIASLKKNSITLVVNGDSEKWKKIRSGLEVIYPTAVK